MTHNEQTLLVLIHINEWLGRERNATIGSHTYNAVNFFSSTEWP